MVVSAAPLACGRSFLDDGADGGEVSPGDLDAAPGSGSGGSVGADTGGSTVGSFGGGADDAQGEAQTDAPGADAPTCALVSTSGGANPGTPMLCHFDTRERCVDGNSYEVTCLCPPSDVPPTCLCASSVPGSSQITLPNPGCQICDDRTAFTLCGYPSYP